jgi:lysophospholipase L1-like esterase
MKMKLQKFIVVALLVCMIFSSVSFAVTKWACAGDSITEGYGLKRRDPYPYKLGGLLGSEYDVNNYGHSSRTMLRAPVIGYPYWESREFTSSQDFLPDIVTIMFGTNDAHPQNWPMLSDEFYQDAIDMITVYQNLPSNPRVIIMTVPPVPEISDRYQGISELNPMIPEIATVAGCELIDVWTAVENCGLTDEEKFIDTLHLSAAAHTVVAELLFDYINGPPWVPPLFYVSPNKSYSFAGPVGGPFNPGLETYKLINNTDLPLDWSASNSETWLVVSPSSGTIGANSSIDVDVYPSAAADSLPEGIYSDTITFEDTTNSITILRDITIQAFIYELVGHWTLDETTGSVASDSSGNGLDGTLQGGLLFDNDSVAGSINSALQMDGVDDYVEVPAMNLGNNVATITCWVKRNGNQSGWNGFVFSRDGSTVAGLNFGTANELRYHWNNATNTWDWDSGLVVPDATWTFCALVVEPSKATIYMDDGSGLASSVNSVSHSAEEFDGMMWLGRDPHDGNRYFNGALDQVRFFNYALSQSEIEILAAEESSICGDGTCDPGEDQCNCPDDCGTPPSTETSCTDGIDNDCDTDVDCDDSDCIGDPACPTCGDGTCDPGEDQCNCPEDCGTPPSTETSCTDGIDNDCDTYTDCDDSDCDDDPACAEPYCGDGTCDPDEDQCNCPEDCGTPPSTETSCTDGIDNDCDTYTDCDDSDCDGDPACPDCVEKGGACTADADCCSGDCLPAGKCK